MELNSIWEDIVYTYGWLGKHLKEHIMYGHKTVEKVDIASMRKIEIKDVV